MPFDESHEDHGGGGDPRHEGLEALAKNLVNCNILAVEVADKCLTCTLGSLGITLLSKIVRAHRVQYGDDEAMYTYMEMIQELAEACGLETETSHE